MEEAPAEKKKSRSKEGEIEDREVRADSRPTERLGHMLMAVSEKAPVSHTGRSALEAVGRSVERSLRPSSEKRSATMSRAELMRLSEEISVDGSSLRQIYETHLIGERGLRRLVAEYERGGDLKKVLREEIIAREMDFERDPAMRDMDVTHWADDNKVSKADKATLNKLLEEASANLGDSSEQAAFFKARALYEANQLQQHKQQRRWIDITMIIVISVLVIMVLALLSRR